MHEPDVQALQFVFPPAPAVVFVYKWSGATGLLKSLPSPPDHFRIRRVAAPVLVGVSMNATLVPSREITGEVTTTPGPVWYDQ